MRHHLKTQDDDDMRDPVGAARHARRAPAENDTVMPLASSEKLRPRRSI